jgi:NADH-quinone oxidoreductase subunit H
MDLLDWVLLAARVIVVFAALMVFVIVLVWAERKVAADMQTRKGPMRAGPRGILITLADGLKLLFKEGITPALADRPVYLVAPVVAMLPAFLSFCVIPFGTGVTLFGRHVPFRVADLNVGILWVLAMSSLTVYGIVLAGWSSGSNYPLLGSLRSSAQMISYEIGMSLAIVAVVMYSGSLQMSHIVASQSKVWNVIPQFPAFVIYLICGIAETGRPPFDLPEAESELVAGYFTEYSGFKFAMFYLGEYLNTVTVAAVAVTLFLGGWRGPAPHFLPWLWPLVWFVAKLVAVIYLYMWVRLTLPRFRYDRLMAFGWKVLLPFGLFWVLATGAVVVLPDVYGKRPVLIGTGVLVAVVLLVSLVASLFGSLSSRSQASRSQASRSQASRSEEASR